MIACAEVQGPIELGSKMVCSRCYEDVTVSGAALLGGLFDVLRPSKNAEWIHKPKKS